MPEVIPIASDHAGFELKERLVEELRALGYEPQDLGTIGPSPPTTPTTRTRWRAASNDGRPTGGAVCGTGLGMSYTANRYPHVRAAVAWTPEIAELAREHNDANVLVLPARFVSEEGRADPEDVAGHAVRRRPAQPPRRQRSTEEHG